MYLIMHNGWKTTCLAGQSMINVERMATNALIQSWDDFTRLTPRHNHGMTLCYLRHDPIMGELYAGCNTRKTQSSGNGCSYNGTVLLDLVMILKKPGHPP